MSWAEVLPSKDLEAKQEHHRLRAQARQVERWQEPKSAGLVGRIGSLDFVLT